MLKNYSNKDELLAAKKALSANRIDKLDYDLLKFPRYRISHVSTLLPSFNQRIELHVYSNETWITGNHSITATSDIPTQYFGSSTSSNDQKFPYGILNISILDEFNNLGITAGKFRFVLNFFTNLIGNYDNQYLKISEISPDRTEVKLSLIDKENQIGLSQIASYASSVRQTYENGNKNNPNVTETYILNFSQNNCAQFVNSVVVGEHLYVKLLKPLDSNIEEKFKCWVVKEDKLPYVDSIHILADSILDEINRLSGPNWQANSEATSISTETDLKSWNDLLGSSIQTSQQIIDSYFSGSLSGIDLNIQYHDFNNFVFYSSAAERVANFKYKLGLIETYVSQSKVISNITSNISTTNANDFNILKTNLISGFDEFEQYLYYESSSIDFTHDIYLSNDINVSELTGSYIQPAPKSNSTIPYSIMSVTSSEFNVWYNALYYSASLYDNYNNNILTKGIPEFIRFDSNNSDMDIFVNMLGHHFDILYTYVKYLSKLYERDEHPKRGVPNELLYQVAKQFGWNLSIGNQGADLWEYLYGTNELGTPITGSLSVGDPGVSRKDMTFHVWRRIVNNLPYLLKSKGTKRSIKALLSCYGIPQSMISINEYGGPKLTRTPIYESHELKYALDLINNSAGTTEIDYSGQIRSVELRFRTDNVLTNPSMPSTMNLYSVGGNNVTIDFNSGTLGTIRINTTASGLIDCFDGEFVNTLLRSGSDNGTLELIAQKSKFGKITTTVSASVTGSFPSTGKVILGGEPGGNGGSRLQGQLQEFRLWTSSLDLAPFSNHTKAPGAYDGNIDTYNELLFRLPLTENVNHNLTSSLLGIEPNESNISASFFNWSNSNPYNSFEETYFYDAITVGNDTFDDNKIRIEDNKLIAPLSVNNRAEQSQYDTAPKDSPKLGVFYSPQTIINEDIISQLGRVNLEDYIGDPIDNDSRNYSVLEKFANTYWKKYKDKSNLNDFLSIFKLFDLTFFSQIDQLLPARAEKIKGLLLQPTLLERSKDSTDTGYFTKFNETYNTEIILSDSTKNITSSIHDLSSNLIIDDYRNNTIDGSISDNLIAYLTSSSDSYASASYQKTSLRRQNGAWVTDVTPYWESEAVSPIILDSRKSNIYQKKFISSSIELGQSSGYGTATYGNSQYGSTLSVNSKTIIHFSYSFADVQDYNIEGGSNSLYMGSKLIGKDFNIEPTRFEGDFKTVDGGPVVEFTDINPNKITLSQPGSTGAFVIEKLKKKKSRKRKGSSGEEPRRYEK